jgi:hypothetical protein
MEDAPAPEAAAVQPATATTTTHVAECPVSAAQRRLLRGQLAQAAQLAPDAGAVLPAVIAALRRVRRGTAPACRLCSWRLARGACVVNTRAPPCGARTAARRGARPAPPPHARDARTR